MNLARIAGLTLLLICSGLAADPEAEQPAEESGATSRENPASRIPYESGKDSILPCEDRWSNFLPFLGRAACERGYMLPRPFGVSVGYMHQEQPFDVGNIYVNGIEVTGPGLAVVEEVDNEEGTVTLRLDAWIFPFWNVYGIAGRTDGDAEGPLEIDLEPLFPFLCSLPGNNCLVNTTFTLKYEGDVLGYGTTIAGGYKDFFGMVDANYTKTDLDISTTDAEATVVSGRIGWNGKLGGFTGVLWVGAMYQDIEQYLDIPINIGQDLINVTIEQATQESTNYLVGGQWDISRSWYLLAEFGFGERTSQMVNLTYRF